MLKADKLLIEYRKNPLGLGEKKPHFSWKLFSDESGVFQTSYRIVVSDSKSVVWDTGRVFSDESCHIEYSGNNLEPKTKYNVEVEVTDNRNSSAKTTGAFETDFLGDNTLWKAKWLKIDASTHANPVPVFSKHFTVDKYQSARLYITACGLYEAYINGKRVGDYLLTPGYTVYSKRLQYQVYDVAEYITSGDNVIEIYLGQGWAAWFASLKHQYSILAQLEIFDGNKEVIIPTDSTWECRTSPLRMAEIYCGNRYWGTDEALPVKYEALDLGYDVIISQQNEPVRILQRIKPVKLIHTPKGEDVLDFGVNVAGIIEIKLNMKRGERIAFTHGEILDSEGNFFNENLRGANQLVEIVSDGKLTEYKARMTSMGFRYVKLDVYPYEINTDDFTLCVISTELERTGHFEASNELLTKLYQNVIRSNMANFIDIPTDCPQRSERLGWTGDIQVFSKTAVQNFSSILFFKKWLGDVAADQYENGAIPDFVPRNSCSTNRGAAGWGDAAVLCPWENYIAYGNKWILERQYDSICKWIEFIKSRGDNPYLWTTDDQFGDWLALDTLVRSFNGGTSREFIASAYYANSVEVAEKIASVLGKEDDVKYFDELHQNIIKAIRYEFVSPAGRLTETTQTAHAVALKFGLVENKAKVAEKLNKLVISNYDKLTTGFLGTPLLCDMLEENGYPTKAYDLLLQEAYPSWLFCVKMGATSIWEHWDGVLPDGSLCPDTMMNSYNHYAYGAIADFMYKKVAGIRPLTPGYKTILIKPVIDKRLTYAKASVDTVYGVAASSWQLTDSKFSLDVNIPCNTSATVVLPNGESHAVCSGHYSFECAVEMQ